MGVRAVNTSLAVSYVSLTNSQIVPQTSPVGDPLPRFFKISGIYQVGRLEYLEALYSGSGVADIPEQSRIYINNAIRLK
jgi:hypothetical protein